MKRIQIQKYSHSISTATLARLPYMVENLEKYLK